MSTTTTTYYPNDLYSKEGATTTRFIYGNGELLASVEGNGAATTTQYYHQDHLGSTRLITNSVGVGVQVLDYYPYGAPRIDNGAYDADRAYIGEVYDNETELSYLNARYMESKQGQFLSQDPVFLDMGLTTSESQVALQNPQVQNSYSYGQNNPITNKDPDGRCPVCALMLIGAAANVGAQFIEDYTAGNDYQWQNYAGAAVGGAVGAASLLTSGGSSAVVAGALTSGTEEYATQWFNGVSGKSNGSINASAIVGQAIEGGVFGQISKYIKIPAVTTGRNSLQAVTNSTFTKVTNGTIQNFSGTTGSKVLATQALGNAPQSVYNGGSSNKSLQKQIQSLQKQVISLLQKKVNDLKKKLGK